MNYEGQICRSPMERSSFMLPVAVGCSYNLCKFCTLFKHLHYRELPLEQIEAELERVRNMGGNPETVFLGDGNAFGMKTDRLLKIADMIHRCFPGCKSINMDATVTNIQSKTDEELLLLQAAGVRHLYLGIEGALDDVLQYMKKDHSVSQALRQIDRLRKAGLIYDAHFMTGFSGRGRGTENARCLASFFNETRPARIINFSMFLSRNAPLYDDIRCGSFVPATELENLKEEKLLLELMDAGPVIYDGFHDFIEFRVRGILPADREKMLQKLDTAIAKWENREPLVAFSCPEHTA